MTKPLYAIEPKAVAAMRLLLTCESLRDRLGHKEVVARYLHWREEALRLSIQPERKW